MKFTFKTTFLGGELIVETDTLSDILDVFTAVEHKKGPIEKDLNQMEVPLLNHPMSVASFKGKDLAEELALEVKEAKKKQSAKIRKVAKEVAVQIVEKESNIAGVEIAEEVLPVWVNTGPVEEPKTYTTTDLQKAIIDFVTKAPTGQDERKEKVKTLVLKYSKTTATADFPVKKIGEFLKDLEALD